jgi:hypothetical protein
VIIFLYPGRHTATEVTVVQLPERVLLQQDVVAAVVAAEQLPVRQQSAQAERAHKVPLYFAINPR